MRYPAIVLCLDVICTRVLPSAADFAPRSRVRLIERAPLHLTKLSEIVVCGVRIGVLSGPYLKMLTISLSAAHEFAVRQLVRFLDECASCYQFTGGLAGNLHGSRWPLHDLDLDVAKQDLPRLARFLDPFTYYPLGYYEDAEFRLHLLRARIGGVELDISQAEDAYGRVGGEWISLGTDLSRRQRAPLLDMQVWVQPLDALIAYKELIGRSADVAELQTLEQRSS